MRWIQKDAKQNSLKMSGRCIDREGFSAKFWLKKVALSSNHGFSKKELNKLDELVTKHQKQFLDSWHGYFGFKK